MYLCKRTTREDTSSIIIYTCVKDICLKFEPLGKIQVARVRPGNLALVLN